MATDAREDAPSSDDGGGTHLEDRRWGRAVISLGVLAILVAVLGTNLPDSVVTDGLLTVTRPVLDATGLDQNWRVFAPDPPSTTGRTFARVDHVDGAVSTRDIPFTTGVSEYWNYRWAKYGESLAGSDSVRPEQETYARWVADEDRATGGHPVRVTLVRRVHETTAPGPPPDDGPFRDVPFFTTTTAP